MQCLVGQVIWVTAAACGSCSGAPVPECAQIGIVFVLALVQLVSSTSSGCRI
jgi:predicted branched-subunit amino acid permease